MKILPPPTKMITMLGVVAVELRRFPGFLWRILYKVGRDDPRRGWHAMKVGFAMTFASLVYLLDPVYRGFGFGQNVMWAVMTVVVVLEFTAGAALRRLLTRVLGTILGISLAFLVKYIGDQTGPDSRPVFLGVATFIVGISLSYIRFIPNVKKHYDYGMLIFMVTFVVMTVCGYRLNDVVKIARERICMIGIGCGIALFTSLFIVPIWSGCDLHNSTVSKLESLAKAIEAFVKEYFADADENKNTNASTEDLVCKIHKVLDSKSQDESSATFASWEPRHSLRGKYPWEQYVKLGIILRQFGYPIVALHGCLHTKIQTSSHYRAMFKDPCLLLATEVSKILMELATSIKMRRHSNPMLLSDHLHKAIRDLKAELKSQQGLFLVPENDPECIIALMASQAKLEDKLPATKEHQQYPSSWDKEPAASERETLRPQLSKIAVTSLEFCEALPFAAFAFQLLKAATELDTVIGEVEKLGKMASFEEFEVGCDQVVVNLETPRLVGVAPTNLPLACAA